MFKKFLATLLVAIICLTGTVAFSGCVRSSDFTVTFVGNADDAVLYHGDAVQTVSDASEIKEPIFIRRGYNFAGWSKAITEINEDTVVKANWSKYNITVTFEGNGGFDGEGNGTVTKVFDSGINIKPPAFVKTGYTLSWDIDFATVTKSCTANAIWTAKNYTLSFVDDTGASLGYDNMTVTYGEAIADFAAIPTKTGYKFAGWIDENGNPIDRNMGWLRDGNAVAKARYVEEDLFVILYELEGGCHYGENVYCLSENTQEITIEQPRKVGHKFKGWKIKHGENITNFPVVNVTLDNLKKNGELSDVTLIATWEVADHTITFDANGGEILDGAENQRVITYGEKIGELPIARKEGYRFVGWRYQNVNITSNTSWLWDTAGTLVAQYKREYVVKFDLVAYVKQLKVECKLITSGDLKLNGKRFEETEIKVLEGQSLIDVGIDIMPIVDPLEPENYDIYVFGGYWEYCDLDGTRHKVLSDTILNESTVPGAMQNGVVNLVPHCKLRGVDDSSYIVRFDLTSIVRGKEVECSLVSAGDVNFDSGDIERISIVVPLGQSLSSKGISILPIVDPIEPSGWDEYSFGGYWKYVTNDNKLHKVDETTIFNEKNFPNVSDDRVIVLIPHCRAHWTPSY